MDPDMASDREPSPQPYAYDDDEEDWGRERSPTPVMDSDAGGLSKGKPRKRLVKKSGGAVKEIEVDFDEARAQKRKKEKEGGVGGGKKEKRFKKDKGLKTRSKEGSLSSNDAGDREMKEMKELWDTIAGAESEVIGFRSFYSFLLVYCLICLSFVVINLNLRSLTAFGLRNWL